MERREILTRSVDSLERIYAVVVALAVTIAIQRLLFDENSKVRPFFDDQTQAFILWKTILEFAPTLIAFVAAIVPFYHGMNRHLDRIYVERDVEPAKEGFLVADFVVFFIESCLLVAFASLLATKDYAFLVLMVLLVVDLLWAFITYGIHYGAIYPSTARWGTINAVTVVILWLFYFANWFSGSTKSWALCIVVVVRAVADYYWCWHFYFPPQHGANSGQVKS